MASAGAGSVVAANAFEQAGLAYVITSANTVTVTGGASGNSATEITIPDAVTSNGTTYSVTTIGFYDFGSAGITSVTIGNSVTTIDDEAFYDNRLTSLTIPDSVTDLGATAFSYNTLTSVSLLGNFESYDLSMFTGNSNLTTITFVQGKTSWPKTFTPAGSGSDTTTSQPATP